MKSKMEKDVALSVSEHRKSGARISSRKVLVIFGMCISMACGMIYGQAKLTIFGQPEERALVVGLVIPTKTAPLAKVSIATTRTGDVNAVSSTPMQNTGAAAAVTQSRSLETISEKEPLNGCGNSERWLNTPRLGNLDDPLITDDVAEHMIFDAASSLQHLSQMSSVLGTTICHADSRFRNTTIPTGDYDDDAFTKAWTFKLIYLAVHYHQHKFAVPEAMARYRSDDGTCQTRELKSSFGVNKFDFECPEAKYIIMPLCGNGIGANVRGGMVPALLMGLISGRVVLFVNNAGAGNRYLRSTWPLASCEREDYQCFFWATSPCTLTKQEIENAYSLTRPEYRALMKRNRKTDEIEHHKVWTFNSQFLPITEMPLFASSRIFEIAQKMIDTVPEPQGMNEEYVNFLRKAAESIKDTDEARLGYNYAAANLKISHALTFYLMRPNPSNAQKVNAIMEEIIPESFQPDLALGLPIRGSDKCDGESECLTFEQHMQVSTDMWQRHQNATGVSADPTVVFTTEAKSVVQEQLDFVSSNAQSKFPLNFDFVSNTKDMHPDTGFIKEVGVSKNGVDSAADDIMVSSISSLKAQLLPRVSIGNCCSNYHVMLNDFLTQGCGAATDSTFLCLQEYHDILLRVCCGWHTDCKEAKKDFLLNQTRASMAAS